LNTGETINQTSKVIADRAKHLPITGDGFALPAILVNFRKIYFVNPSLRKIGLLILLIIVLPLLIFSVFEIGNLRQNEKVIQDIYTNQLDAILFSINQYSDDIVGNLASRIEHSMNRNNPQDIQNVNALIKEMPPVISMQLFDKNLNYLESVPKAAGDSSMQKEILAALKSNHKTLQRLSTYNRGGYRKIETIGNNGIGIQWIVFLSAVNNKEIINVLVIKPESFISQVLDPKMQEIARGKFYIAAFRDGEEVPFYSTNKQINPGKVANKKPFWLMKDYKMGIELKNLTISDLARDRMRRNLLLIGIMDLLLVFGAWLIFRNISKQVELSQLKSDFVSNVSHEIRTPLALISMYIETLEMGRIKDKAKINEYYAVILNETARLSGIVNRILSFSQIDNKKRKYFFSSTRLNDIVESTVLTFRYTLETKGFTCSFEPGEPLPPVQGDKDAIAEALVNLIDNAMKYSEEHKHIVIRTGRTDNFVYIEVEDRGIGINLKDQRYIFDKFYRVTGKNLANRVKGSGLGLAIVKHIMDAHRGKIFVRSSPGEGSLFRLLFPENNKQS
jgi:two-component system phosphate regulon sensor histidine kinase PhoR